MCKDLGKRNTTKSIGKVHMHLSSHMEAKQLLKKVENDKNKNKRRIRRFVFRSIK